MSPPRSLDEEHQILDEFEVAGLLHVKVGVVRGMRRRGVGPDWFRVDGRSPRYTLASVRRYIAQLSQCHAAMSRDRMVAIGV
jgi:hypothetical protein